MDSPILTATMICRCALLHLETRAERIDDDASWPTWAESYGGGVEGLFGLIIFIEDDDLRMSLEAFYDSRLIPAMAAWERLFRDRELGPQLLILPKGFSGAANAVRDSISMRCLIEENRPVGDRDIPSRVARYYDITADEFKEAPCSMAISLWVHTPDTTARLAEEPANCD